MQQLLNIWDALDAKRRFIVGVATIAVFAGVLILTRIAAQPDMDLLYSGLSPSTSGEIITALEAQGAEYEVKGGAIFVEATMRDQLRMILASDGLPANDSKGYELLDNLSGFGTTSQMFDAAHLRAKEGELARTILASPQIEAARVHIAAANSSPFRRDQKASASVSVRSADGGISSQTAEAIRYLVSSAVSGLSPHDISIIDADRGLIAAKAAANDPVASAAGKAENLKQNVERLIEARTGIGNAIIEVNVETVQDAEVLVERRIDPESRVAMSVETRESTTSARNQNGGGVTVASNLPDGDAGGGQDESTSQNSDTREVTNYEVSETTRELRRNPGSIKRISVAVLVGEITQIGEDGLETQTPRNTDELANLEALVKSAVGFDAERGDEVTVRSMALDLPTPDLQTANAEWITSRPFDVMGLSKFAISALVILGLGAFVIRPILLAPPLALPANTPDLLLGAEPEETPSNAALTGEIAELGDMPAGGSGMPNIAFDPNLVSTDFPMGGGFDPQNEDPVERLKTLIEERQDETIEVLKNWLETPEERT